MFEDAAAYERFMGRWSALLAPALLDALDLEGLGLGACSTVLDIGCGTGSLALAVADRWPSAAVTGIDPSAAFVSAAADRAPSPLVRFRVGDATHLPLADDSVDAALAALVLNFVPDPQRALEEMCRVTRPGGVLAAAVWDYGGGMGMLRTFWDAATRLDATVQGQDEASTPLGRPGGLKRLWRTAGVAEVSDGRVEVVTGFASFDDYWEPFLSGTGPAGVHTRSLSDAGRASLREELLDRLGAGPFELSARAWWVRGRCPSGSRPPAAPGSSRRRR